MWESVLCQLKLVQLIAQHLSSRRDLSSWSRASKKFYYILTSGLYETVALSTEGQHLAFGRALCRNTSLGELVKGYYVSREDYRYGYDGDAERSIITRLPRLEHLVLISGEFVGKASAKLRTLWGWHGISSKLKTCT